MRFVYMDEAGTSAEEPLTVVVGVIVDADRQLANIDRAISERLKSVPREILKNGYVFSAKDVWGNRDYRDTWSMSNRLEFLKGMMSIPRRLGAAISYGFFRRNTVDWASSDWNFFNLKNEQWDHLWSFMGAVSRADLYIRDKAKPREIASIVAEDHPELRSLLRAIPYALNRSPLIGRSDKNCLVPTAKEKEQGYITQVNEMRVERIRSPVHFVNKNEEVAVYLADVCAWGLKKRLAGMDFGDEFESTVFGKRVISDDHSCDAVFGYSDYPTIDTHPDEFL